MRRALCLLRRRKTSYERMSRRVRGLKGIRETEIPPPLLDAPPTGDTTNTVMRTLTFSLLLCLLAATFVEASTVLFLSLLSLPSVSSSL